MSEMLYGQIMAQSTRQSDIGETVTFTDESGISVTGTIGNDGYCRKKLPAFKNYVVTFGNFESDPIALGCGENHYLSVAHATVQVTIYSAKGDTLSYTDVHGDTQLITFDSDQCDKLVVLEIGADGSEFTFTSAIAKNQSDLSAYYSKTVNVDAETTEIFIMPEHTLYWYGYENGVEDCVGTNGWSNSTPSAKPLTPSLHNKNNVFLSTTYNVTTAAFGTSSTVKDCTVYCHVTAPNAIVEKSITDNKQLYKNNLDNSPGDKVYSFAVSGSKYFAMYADNGGYNINSIWYV